MRQKVQLLGFAQDSGINVEIVTAACLDGSSPTVTVQRSDEKASGIYQDSCKMIAKLHLTIVKSHH